MLNTPPKPSTLKARAVAPWECELPSFYRVHPCGSQNVTDALRDEVSYWEPRNPIFISAPTGRGKSHFFKTVLLPDALSRNRTMLIIGNRIALSMQQKMELLEEYETSDAAAQRSMASRFWNAEDTQTRTYFHLISGQLYPNDLAFHKLRRQYRFYEQLQNNEITFADAVRGWLGKKPERSAEQSLKDLQTFCQSHVDSALEEDTFQLLRDLAIKAVSGSGFYEDHPERLPEMGPEGVNHRLNCLKLPYQVKKCRKNLWLRANAESPEES